jgi:hypothetical protein
MARPAGPASFIRHRLRAGGVRLRHLPVPAATALVVSLAAPTAATAADSSPAPTSAGHQQAVLAAKPYMGWSSWSLEATSYPGYGGVSWLTEAHVKQQADVVASKLRSHGYEYINVDAGWVNGFDEYARPKPNTTTFPHGMKSLGDYLHHKGL